MKAPQTMDEVTEQLIAMGEIEIRPNVSKVEYCPKCGGTLHYSPADVNMMHANGDYFCADVRAQYNARAAVARARQGALARAEFERRNSQPLEGGREGLLDG